MSKYNKMHCKCGVRNYNNNCKSIQEEDKVLGKRCVICAFPSRWYMGDGSKVRMVAFIDKDDMNDVPDRVYKYGTY